MNLDRFDDLLDDKNVVVCQAWREWQAFLEFTSAYFMNRKVLRPIVVELGVENGGQKEYYKKLMNAEHIGIDREEKRSKPDILGDVLDKATQEKLLERLSGRRINLLFIDLWVQKEEYNTLKQAYDFYGGLTVDVIAIHSIHCRGSAQEKLWTQIHERQGPETKISIFQQFPKDHIYHVTRMGIGVIVK